MHLKGERVGAVMRFAQTYRRALVSLGTDGRLAALLGGASCSSPASSF